MSMSIVRSIPVLLTDNNVDHAAMVRHRCQAHSGFEFALYNECAVSAGGCRVCHCLSGLSNYQEFVHEFPIRRDHELGFDPF